MATGIKRLFILILFLLSLQLYAQRINGVVIDRSTSLPIQNVSITTSLSTSFSSLTGKFSLANIHIGDTIKFSCVGYKPYHLILNKINIDTLIITLEQNSTILKAVTINSTFDYKADSIKRRKEFASLFNYKFPTFKDIFISRSSYSTTPYSYNTAPNNTTSIISVNLLSAIGLIGKSNAPQSKLQKVLIRDEEDSYIDHLFSKRKVAAITHLKNDSLSEFMNRYRPLAKDLRKMNDYDLINYIKNSYQKFKNN